MTTAKAAHQTYAASWTRKRRADARALHLSTQEKLAAARRMGSILAGRYGVSRVYLFGSLARGEMVHESSDVDLAVEGLSPDRYFEALVELWDLLPRGAELDLVPVEYASPEMLAIVRSQGVVLHGA
jgi:predicted nucleotidyltransferase